MLNIKRNVETLSIRPECVMRDGRVRKKRCKRDRKRSRWFRTHQSPVRSTFASPASNSLSIKYNFGSSRCDTSGVLFPTFFERTGKPSPEYQCRLGELGRHNGRLGNSICRVSSRNAIFVFEWFFPIGVPRKSSKIVVSRLRAVFQVFSVKFTHLGSFFLIQIVSKHFYLYIMEMVVNFI